MIIRNEMPALTYLKLDVPNRLQFLPQFLSSSTPNPTSDSLKHLALNSCKISELFCLFRFLPTLGSVSIDSLSNGSLEDSLEKTKIRHLRIKIEDSSNVTLDNLTKLLATMPWLKTFSLQAFGQDFADGNKWKYIIENNMPLLTKFRFEFRIFGFINIYYTMRTFQTDFWSEIKKWSVKYDYEKSEKKLTRIYTIS